MLIAQLSDSHLKRPSEVAYGGHVDTALFLRKAISQSLADSSARDRSARAECFTQVRGMAKRRASSRRGAIESKTAELRKHDPHELRR